MLAINMQVNPQRTYPQIRHKPTQNSGDPRMPCSPQSPAAASPSAGPVLFQGTPAPAHEAQRVVAADLQPHEPIGRGRAPLQDNLLHRGTAE